jgi:hypothetical protein
MAHKADVALLRKQLSRLAMYCADMDRAGQPRANANAA